MPRELAAADEKYQGCVKKRAMNNMRKVSQYGGKGEIRQNIEARSRKRLGSEFALGLRMTALGLTSEGIRHFRGRKSAWMTEFVGD
jgi:hypothetical protein